MSKLIESTHVSLGGEIGERHRHRRDVASFVANLKQQPGGDVITYGNGQLDSTLMEHGLIDEFHFLVTPVAVGRGQHLFESIDTAPALNLADVTRFSNGVVILVYTPR